MLVYPDQSPDDRMISDRDVARQGRRIGHYQMTTEVAVVRHMDVGHQKILVADGGHPPTLNRPSIDGHIFSDDVVVADDHSSRLPPVLKMLRRGPDRGKGIHVTPVSDLGPPINIHMGDQPGPAADSDMLADHRVRADGDVLGQLRVGMDDGCGMNIH